MVFGNRRWRRSSLLLVLAWLCVFTAATTVMSGCAKTSEKTPDPASATSAQIFPIDGLWKLGSSHEFMESGERHVIPVEDFGNLRMRFTQVTVRGKTKAGPTLIRFNGDVLNELYYEQTNSDVVFYRNVERVVEEKPTVELELKMASGLSSYQIQAFSYNGINQIRMELADDGGPYVLIFVRVQDDETFWGADWEPSERAELERDEEFVKENL